MQETAISSKCFYDCVVLLIITLLLSVIYSEAETSVAAPLKAITHQLFGGEKGARK